VSSKPAAERDVDAMGWARDEGKCRHVAVAVFLGRGFDPSAMGGVDEADASGQRHVATAS